MVKEEIISGQQMLQSLTASPEHTVGSMQGLRENHGSLTQYLSEWPDEQVVLAVAELFTEPELNDLLHLMEPYGASSILRLRDGSSKEVENYSNQEFLTQLPQLFRLAVATGLTREDAVALVTLVHTEDEYKIPQYRFEALQGMITGLQLAAQFGTKFDKDELFELVKLAGSRSVVGHTFLCLGEASALGIELSDFHTTVSQVQETQFDQGGTLLKLRNFYRQARNYGVSPQIANEAISDVLRFREVGQVIDGLSRTIEVDVLGNSQPAGTALSKVSEITSRFTPPHDSSAYTQALFAELINKSSEDSLLIGDEGNRSSTSLTISGGNPDFPIVEGDLRHSVLPYALHKSFESGTMDLLALAMEPGVIEEGAFVFNPEQSVWYSLAGKSSVQGDRRAVQTEFINFDMSSIGHSLCFVHAHTQAIFDLFYMGSRSIARPELIAATNLFFGSTPSDTDLFTLASLQLESAQPVDLTGVIVHPYGITRFRVLKPEVFQDEGSTMFRDSKDELLVSPPRPLDELCSLSDREIVEVMLGALSDRWEGVLEVENVFWSVS